MNDKDNKYKSYMNVVAEWKIDNLFIRLAFMDRKYILLWDYINQVEETNELRFLLGEIPLSVLLKGQKILFIIKDIENNITRRIKIFCDDEHYKLLMEYKKNSFKEVSEFIRKERGIYSKLKWKKIYLDDNTLCKSKACEKRNLCKLNIYNSNGDHFINESTKFINVGDCINYSFRYFMREKR